MVFQIDFLKMNYKFLSVYLYLYLYTVFIRISAHLKQATTLKAKMLKSTQPQISADPPKKTKQPLPP